MANITIMTSVSYAKCYFWLMNHGKCDYAKCKYGKSIIANETEPMILL